MVWMRTALLSGALGFTATALVGAAAPVRALYRSIEGSQQATEGAAHERRSRKIFSGKFQRYKLAEIIPMTHDVALFRFLLPNGDDEFNLRPCSTLQAQFKLGVSSAEQVQRFYTPVTANGERGYFDIIVKRKAKGRMTNHIFGLHVGDELMFRCVAFKLRYEANRWEHVGMIAGGTGFTPMLQVVRHALTEPRSSTTGKPDQTKLSFLFCNRTERHILLKGLFDRLAKDYPERFELAYSVDAAIEPDRWEGYTGYITEEMVRRHMPPPSMGDKCIILLCGPDQLLNYAAGVPLSAGSTLSGSLSVQPIAVDAMNLTRLGGILGNVGYDDSQVYRF